MPRPKRPDEIRIGDRLARVLVTGTGGPAGLGFLRLVGLRACNWYAADADPTAAGLYLVDLRHRVVLPPAVHPDYVDTLLEHCVERKIDVLVPTVDAELVVLSAARDRFAAHGIRLLMAPDKALDLALDKWELAQHCQHVVRVPDTTLLLPELATADLEYPLVAKPRRGSGSRGVFIATDHHMLADLPRDGSYLIQELLPGAEYSVDVLFRQDGELVAAVPRIRDKVDSGVAVAGRTVADPSLATLAVQVAAEIGVLGVANVQVRMDRAGRPALLEVNPRLPGTLTLTAAAGVNMARLALLDILGVPVPTGLAFEEVAMVRYLTEKVLGIDDYLRHGTTGRRLASEVRMA